MLRRPLWKVEPKLPRTKWPIFNDKYRICNQVQESQASSNRVVELEVELQDTVARGEEMLIEGQDSVKKELIKRFPTEDFSKIDNIFSKEKENEDE